MENNVSASIGQTVPVHPIDYKKMTKFVVDAKDLKQDAEGVMIRESYTRSALIDGQWMKIPDALYYDEEFRKFILENFNEEPALVEDEGKTHYYNLKIKTEVTGFANESRDVEDIPDDHKASATMDETASPF